MSSKNYFYIKYDYGYNKQNFNLIENFESKQNSVCDKKILKQYKPQNKNIKKEIKKEIKKKSPTNTFPLAWTCYKNGNDWICPMRGDK